MGKTLFEKIWDRHVVKELPGGEVMLYIDRHLVHEVTSPQAFEGLRLQHRKVRRPELTFATTDHNVPTDSRTDIFDPVAREQVETLEKNCAEHGITFYGMNSERQGVVTKRRRLRRAKFLDFLPGSGRRRGCWRPAGRPMSRRSGGN